MKVSLMIMMKIGNANCSFSVVQVVINPGGVIEVNQFDFQVASSCFCVPEVEDFPTLATLGDKVMLCSYSMFVMFMQRVKCSSYTSQHRNVKNKSL